MRKRLLPLITAAALIFSLASCSSGEEPDKAPSGLISESFRYWDGIDRGKVVSHVDGADELDITYGEFFREYFYYLISMDIYNDMSDAYKDTCESQRESIITYLEFEKMLLKIAEEEGIGVSSLTDEEIAELEESAAQVRENFLLGYYDKAVEELGEDAPDDKIKARQNELLNADMARAELPDNIFFEWERNDLIENRLLDKTIEGAEVSEKQVDDMFNDYVEMAKKAYADDVSSYESHPVYPQVYVPDGTRVIHQILLEFDDETASAIRTARTEGNDDEADRLRGEASKNGIMEKAESIIALLNSGNSFEQLQDTYNDDVDDEAYDVVAGSKIYVKEFVDAAFSIDEPGGISAPAVSDYGVHILRYSAEKTLSDEDIYGIRGQMKEYLLEQEKVKLKNDALIEWTEKYKYVRDNDTLKLNVEEEPEPEG